jgi:3-hydroxyisobutyrate dehydrogenase-like beta-hydroxyacid dehydrogenase
MSVVGIVGLGTVGSQIAARLLQTGSEVHGADPAAATAHPLVARGLRMHHTPAAVAREAEVVITAVIGDDSLAAVVRESDGVAAGLSPQQLYIDMSIVSPRAAADAAALTRRTGAIMLDAAVSGDAEHVRQGTLTIMVGGDRAAFQRARPLLRRLADRVVWVGGNGKGALMNLALSISLAAQTLAFSESLALAVRGGVDPVLAAEAMAASSVGSPMLKARAPLMLRPPYEAWPDVETLEEALRLARREAIRLRVPTPSASTAAHALAQAVELGHADRDIAALYEVLQQMGRSPGTSG